MAEEQTQAVQQAATEAAAQNQPHRGPRGGGNRRDGGRGPRRNDRGQQAPEEKQFDERVVHIDRVARVVKGGRRFRFRALVVVGDRKSKVGIGSAKGADVTVRSPKPPKSPKSILSRSTSIKVQCHMKSMPK